VIERTNPSRWALVVVYATAYIPLYLVPHQVTAYLEIQHATVSDAGLLAMIENVALAASNILMVLVPMRWRMKLTIGASIVAAAAELATIHPMPFALLMTVRALVGAGFGAAGFAAGQFIAVSASPSRTFGTANGILALVSGILLALVPHLGGNSAQRIFGPLALLALCLAPVLGRAAGLRRGASRPSISTSMSANARWLTRPVLGMFMTASLLFVPLGGLYVFAGYQGAHLEMSDSSVGATLGWTTIMGLAGGSAASWLCAKLGLVYPVVIACLLAAATCLAIGSASSSGLFVLAFALYGVTYMFAMTVIATICSEADVSGQAAAVLGGWTVLSVGMGTVAVGFLLDGHRAPLAWQIGIIAGLAALIPATLGARAADQPDESACAQV